MIIHGIILKINLTKYYLKIKYVWYILILEYNIIYNFIF